MRRPGKKSGVHATGIGHDQASAAGKDPAQELSFLVEHGRSVHRLHYPLCWWRAGRPARLDERGAVLHSMTNHAVRALVQPFLRLRLPNAPTFASVNEKRY